MLTTDRVAGIGLVLVGALALVESRHFPLGTLRNPGPAYLPVLLAALLLVFATSLVALGGRAERLGALGWSEWRHALAILAVCAFAAVALERLGYRLTVALSVGFLLAVVERKGIWLTAGFAIALAFGSFFLFHSILRTPLPRGPLGL